jgi:protein tyrosine phosphatase
MSPEWVETVDEDERFLPLIQGHASQICENLWLGSEDNVRDLVWLKLNKITRIVTIMPQAVDPTDSGHMSEALKLWFAENVDSLFLEALDTPTQLVLAMCLTLTMYKLECIALNQVFKHVKRAIEFININLDRNNCVIVHCGRGISRSATLVIATLMVRNKMSYADASKSALSLG